MSEDGVTLCREVFDDNSEPTDRGNKENLCLHIITCEL